MKIAVSELIVRFMETLEIELMIEVLLNYKYDGDAWDLDLG